jgi:hypothetical protein
MHSLRYALGSCSSPGEFNLINILSPVALNFGKDFDVSYGILKGNCVPATGLYLAKESAISVSGSSLLTEAT